MIPPKQPPPNWQEISVIIGGILIVINIVGWFVVHSLTKRREQERDLAVKRRAVDLAVSDFDIIITRWIDAIADRQQILPTGFSMQLGGFHDRTVVALEAIRANSLKDIEAVLRGVRAQLGDAAKGRLDEAWKKYQQYQIEGLEEKDPKTGADITTHTDCKNGLIDCLEQMRKISRET